MKHGACNMEQDRGIACYTTYVSCFMRLDFVI